MLKSEVDSLRRQLAERDSHGATIEHLEKQLSSHVAEISVSFQFDNGVYVMNAVVWFLQRAMLALQALY